MLILNVVLSSRYLAEDPSVQVVKSRGELRGYELYLVEQWACSRQSPTLVIVTYTGDPKHSVVVGVLAVPAEEKDWSPRLKVYFKAIQQYHARPKETELGELMVTNLNSFPSALTVISVPDGDIKTHRQAFIVNEDLKRMGCSGRSGMTLSDPTPATQAKFQSMYKTHERVPFFQAVLELVKLCQVALFIFGMLDHEYIDGLLCDVTETSIGNWWTEIGSEYYNIEPTDGILGPTTVAAMLGMLMGARNRLSSWGAPVAKDVFDVDCTKRAISHYQKEKKMERTRRLDRQTLLQLHKSTAKAAAGEGWGVQKAVKSTVAEFGKRGEILSGMVGARDKAGIGDVETLEIDRFKELVSGERAKWLWQGKPRKIPLEHHERSLPDMSNILFGKEEEKEREKEKEKEKAAQPPSRRTHSIPLEELDLTMRKKEESTTMYSVPTPPSGLSMTESAGDKDVLRKAVFKTVSDRVSDARSGLGRIRDGVGGVLRGHASRPSKDDTFESGITSPSISSLIQSSGVATSPVVPGRAFTWKNKPEEYANAFQKKHPDSGRTDRGATLTSAFGRPSTLHPPSSVGAQTPEGIDVRKILAGDASVAPSTVDESDIQGPFLLAERSGDTTILALKRRHSIAIGQHYFQPILNENRWPRRMSFGAAEEAVLGWEEITDFQDKYDTLEEQLGASELAQNLYENILDLKQGLEPWVVTKVDAIESLEDAYARQQDELEALYYQLSDAYQRVKHNSGEMIAEEKGHVTEAIREVEVMVAKLEYEISALVSKVQDVEDGAAQFEKQVEGVEKRAEELKVQLETETWLHWAVRTLTGIGTGPNITRDGGGR